MGSILGFVVFVNALAVVLSLVVWATGGHRSPYIGLAYLTMFMPAIAVLVVGSVTDEWPIVRWHGVPAKYVAIALFLIPVVSHAIVLPVLVAMTGPLPWQEWLTPRADGLFHSPESRGWGTLTMQGLVARIVLNAVFGLVVVSVLAFFEEIGWRAWLLPRLADRFGPRSAVVLTAIVWTIWHVPFRLSGIQHIEGASPLALTLGLSAATMAGGLIIGWLWLRSESIWLVALAHGALNNWGQYAFKYMDDAPPPLLRERIAREIEALNVGALVLLIIGMLLLWRGIPSAPR